MSRVYFYTCGCKLNQYYTDLMRTAILKEGWEETYSIEDANYIVINSCIVTHKAERDVKRAINKALKGKSGKAKIILTGCRGELYRIKNVDFSGSYKEVIKYLSIQECPQRIEISSKIRPFVKIQEGCDLKCSFCIVPRERGLSRSRPLHEILEEIKTLLERGYKEIVLTGTQLGDWGKEWSVDISYLLERILEIPRNFRVRISSISPHRISKNFLELMERGVPRIAPHLHIPLQSGSEKILRGMRRPYTLKKYLNVVEALLSKIPEIAIGTDIIAGFPTETHRDYMKTVEVVRRIPFAYLHIFEFSPRERTEASTLLPLHKVEVRKERVRELVTIAKEKKMEYSRKFIGKTLDILVETEKNGFFMGTSENYLKVLFRKNGAKLLNQFVRVRIEDVGKNFVIGSSIPE